MLRLGDFLGRRTQALVAQLGLRHANAIYVTRREAYRTRESYVEGIQVGTLTAQVASFEHEANVAPAAAAHLGIAKRVFDNPLIDCAGFRDICVCAFCDIGCLGLYD